MGNTLGLNRLEFNILKCLYDSGCVDPYHSMTITELLEKYKELEKRMTIYKKLRKLTEEKYVKKGICDNHADTFDTTCRTACASTHYHYDKKTAPENGRPEHIVGSGKTG